MSQKKCCQGSKSCKSNSRSISEFSMKQMPLGMEETDTKEGVSRTAGKHGPRREPAYDGQIVQLWGKQRESRSTKNHGGGDKNILDSICID